MDLLLLCHTSTGCGHSCLVLPSQLLIVYQLFSGSPKASVMLPLLHDALHTALDLHLLLLLLLCLLGDSFASCCCGRCCLPAVSACVEGGLNHVGTALQPS